MVQGCDGRWEAGGDEGWKVVVVVMVVLVVVGGKGWLVVGVSGR